MDINTQRMLLNTIGVDYHVYYHYKKNCFLYLNDEEARRYKNIIETPYIETCQYIADCIKYKERTGEEPNFDELRRPFRITCVSEEDIENVLVIAFDFWEHENGITVDWNTVEGL